MTQNDGGPAFPTTPIHYGYHEGCSGDGYPASLGLSMRDWFAGQALPQVIAGSSIIEDSASFDDVVDMTKNVARLSYMFADAMLKAREQ